MKVLTFCVVCMPCREARGVPLPSVEELDVAGNNQVLDQRWTIALLRFMRHHLRASCDLQFAARVEDEKTVRKMLEDA